MAKRICDPTSGSIGSQVYGIGRNGQFVRAKVTPANPNTHSQQVARVNFSTQSSRWDALTEDERTTWRTAAGNVRSKMRLGSDGALTGNQHFVQVNARLAATGQDAVDVPAADAPMPANPLGNLVITNAAGALALKLGCPTAPADFTEIWGAPPVKAGVARVPQLFLLGLCPVPAAGSAVITALYTSKFGAPAVGQRIFIGSRSTINGMAGPMVATTAIVPAP